MTQREIQCEVCFLRPCSKDYFVLMQHVHPLVTLEIQIAKTVQSEKLEIRLFENGLVVLGLATTHCRKLT